MDINKIIQTTTFILKNFDNTMPYLNLIKISYLADRKSYERIGHSITGDTYFSMHCGPVLSCMYDLINGTYKDREAQMLWNSRFVTNGYNISIIAQNLPTDMLSRFEQKTLSELCIKYKNYTYRQMIDEVHRKEICPEWQNVSQHSRKPITEESLLKSLGFSEDEIEQTIAENESYRQEAILLK